MRIPAKPKTAAKAASIQSRARHYACAIGAIEKMTAYPMKMSTPNDQQLALTVGTAQTDDA